MTTHLDAAVEVWTLLLVNFLGFLLGAAITGLSYYAYSTNPDNRSLLHATAGFAMITAATAVEPVYQIAIERTHVLASEQNVALQLFEATLLSLGFLVIFLSIYRYESASRRQTVTINGVDDALFDESD